MKPIKPLFIPLKNITRIKHTHTEPAHSGQLHRMNVYQAWQNVGLRQKVYAKADLDTVYSQAEDFYLPLFEKINIKATIAHPKYDPTGVVPTVIGRELGNAMHDLKMSIRNLFKSYATKNWNFVSSYSVHVNRHYIRIMRIIYGEDTMYRNHDMVACGDTFIEPSERTLFGRRKKPVKK